MLIWGKFSSPVPVLFSCLKSLHRYNNQTRAKGFTKPWHNVFQEQFTFYTEKVLPK